MSIIITGTCGINHVWTFSSRSPRMKYTAEVSDNVTFDVIDGTCGNLEEVERGKE